MRRSSEIDGEAVEQFLVTRRAEEDLGARTYNHYLQAIDEFGKWLVATEAAAVNPVAGIDGPQRRDGRPPQAAGARPER